MAWNCWKWCTSSVGISDGIPPPRPPSCRKEKLLAEVGPWERDKDKAIAKTSQILLEGNYLDLASHVTSSCRSDLARVRAIFYWMTSFNYESIKDVSQQASDRPVDGLLGVLNRDNTTLNHAHFFARLARAAGITCVVITGIVKNCSYLIGERGLREDPKKRAQWNAVLIQGEWRLLDVLWASRALVRRREAHWPLVDVHGDTVEDEDVKVDPGKELHETNGFFFLTDPDRFVCTHLPDDPNWQLLPPQLRLKPPQFEKFVYVRERFFTMGLEMLPDSQQYCTLKTDRGEVTVKFGVPEHLGRFAQFRYMLFKYKSQATGGVSDESDDTEKVHWKGCIFYQLSQKQISYVCHMPQVGKYRMDIFGRHVTRDNGLDLVCSYVIECDSTDGRHLPDDPDIGWGPGTELDEAGLSVLTYSDADLQEMAESGRAPVWHPDGTIDTDQHVVEIRFRKTVDYDMVFWHALKHNDFDEAELLSCATLRVCSNDVIAVLRLPQPGMYAYKLFADARADGGDIPNVCNYLVRYRHNDGETITAFPSLQWGLLGPSIHAPRLGIVSTEENVTIGNIVTDSSKVDLTFKMLPSDYDILYEIGAVQQDGIGDDAKVAVNTRDKTAQIQLKLDGSGEYSFNMFVRRRSDDIRIHHVHSVLIGYSGEDAASDASNDEDLPDEQPEPLAEESELNESSFNLRAGLMMMGGMFGFVGGVEDGEDEDDDTEPTLVTHKQMITDEEIQRIDLPLSGYDLLVSVERKASQCPADDIRATYEKYGEALTVNLPLEGVYVVDVFESRRNNRLRHVYRYHITRHAKEEQEEEEMTETDPEPYIQTHEKPYKPSKEEIAQESMFQEAKLRLKHAVSDQKTNVEKLSRAIGEFKKVRGTRDDELLAAAERRLVEIAQEERMFQKAKLRLEHAVSDQKTNMEKLSRAIQEFKKVRGTRGDELIAAAETRLMSMKVSVALTEAMKYRNLEDLEKAIAYAAREGFRDTPRRLLFRAKRMVARLKHIEMLRKEVMEMNHKSMMELRGYNHPPEILSDVIVATLLVLGESKNELKEWQYVARHLLPTARRTIQERIEICDVKKVKIAHALRAKSLVGQYTELAITDVSAVAVPFFKWTLEVIAMIEEPTKKYNPGETDDMPDQQTSDTEQQGQRQSDSQQPDPQPVDTNMSSNGNGNTAQSPNIPLTDLTEPAPENPDREANGDTQRRQHETDGENDGTQQTVV